MKDLHRNQCMFTCGFRINANLVKEGSFRINAKEEELRINLADVVIELTSSVLLVLYLLMASPECISILGAAGVRVMLLFIVRADP